MVSSDDVLHAASVVTTPTGEGAGQAPMTPEEYERLRLRRKIVAAGVGLGVVLTVGGLSALSVTSGLRPIAKVTPDREPPADGDDMVLADDQFHVVTPDDVPTKAGMILVYPRNAETKVVKSGTAENLILLARFPISELSEATAAHAAAGVVAYSAVCPHLGCTVSMWDDERDLFHCPCHHAYFDPRSDARLVEGPSPRALPALPLKLVDGAVTIAGGFLSPVGPG